MIDETSLNYPGGSKTRVNRAGENVRNGIATAEDLDVIEEWRAAHRAVLNTFQAILRNRTKGCDITFAQRHKRKRTIFEKLKREEGMQLSRMDDIAGCRLIFRNNKELYAFRAQFHKAKFNHKRRNEIDKYDYIKHPRTTGYRGVHDVYKYDVKSQVGRKYTGLYVEIQYRTLVQHAWATAVELIGFITESQPKFQKGDKRYVEAMAYASEIFARAFEKEKGIFPDVSDQEVVLRFNDLDTELSLIQTLKGLNAAERVVLEKQNTILMFPLNGELEIKTYRDSTEALRSLFELEKQFPNHDIVLVRANTNKDVRLAFRNYFSDARDFIKLFEKGSEMLIRPKQYSGRGAKLAKYRHNDVDK
jgi:putative GTP pyrophosphokinase